MELKGRSVVELGKELVKEVGDDDLSGSAAELAYRFFLALFPFFIFLAALGGFVADAAGTKNPTDEVMNFLGDTLPEDTASVVRTQLDSVLNNRSGALLTFGIIGALWTASSGISNVMKGMNRVYKVNETRPVWKRYLLALGATLLAGGAVIAAFVLLVAGQIWGVKLADELGLGGAARFLFPLARWPIVIGLLMVAVAFLYWLTPNASLPFRLISPGAVVFVIGWLAASYLFGLYVSNFGSYNATYGALGGIVVLLVWFYLTAFILMLGGLINAVLAREYAPEKLPQTEEEGATPETIPAERRPETRARYNRERQPQGTSLTSQQRPTRDEEDVPTERESRPAVQREGSRSPALEDAPTLPKAKPAPSPAVTVIGVVIAALTFWRLARRDMRPA